MRIICGVGRLMFAVACLSHMWSHPEQYGQWFAHARAAYLAATVAN